MFTNRLTSKQLRTVIGVALVLITAALYAPMLHHQFINFDDDDYITNNARVKAGLTWSGVIWAFRTGAAANWHPLTWISHMLDCQLYGLNPAGHHATNLLFHVVNTLLLFFWLNQITGAVWRSALVAALFAWHPLHVESVAWAAERKDVLSTFFWLLSLMAYSRYAQKRLGTDLAAHPSGFRLPEPNYFLALFWFACGLMSKPMVVTLPFVLLLLDFWPLNRFQIPVSTRRMVRLLIEKIPFLVLAAATSIVTYFVQTSGRALWTAVATPFSTRLANALWAYERYVSKTFLPSDLSIFYPYRASLPAGVVMSAVLFLVLWSGLSFWRIRQNPYLFVGWFWFLGTLIPTIGLVQVGSQSMADRYMYIPGIGLFVVVAWGLGDLVERYAHWRRLVIPAVGAALAACLVGTEIQLGYWQNSIQLFRHALAVSPDNFVAYNCLGEAFAEQGMKQEALTLCAEAVQIAPNNPVAQYNLGMFLAQSGRTDEARQHLDAAARLAPFNSEIQYNLGTFLMLHGEPEAAASHFTAALRERPDFPEAHFRLAQALSQQHKSREAVVQYGEALRLKPDYPDALNEFAWLLSTSPDPEIRDGKKAVQLAQHACELAARPAPVFFTTLSAADAEAGRFSDAIAAAQKARDLAVAAGQKDIAVQDEQLLRLYQGGNPFREAH